MAGDQNSGDAETRQGREPWRRFTTVDLFAVTTVVAVALALAEFHFRGGSIAGYRLLFSDPILDYGTVVAWSVIAMTPALIGVQFVRGRREPLSRGEWLPIIYVLAAITFWPPLMVGRLGQLPLYDLATIFARVFSYGVLLALLVMAVAMLSARAASPRRRSRIWTARLGPIAVVVGGILMEAVWWLPL